MRRVADLPVSYGNPFELIGLAAGASFTDEERAAITELVTSAIAMENLSPGEGLLGMATLAVRQGLALRDAGNRLAHELDQLRREVKTLRDTAASHGKKND